jgi:hypothetical protein
MFFKIKKLKKQVESQNKLTQNVLILPIFLYMFFLYYFIYSFSDQAVLLSFS